MIPNASPRVIYTRRIRFLGKGLASYGIQVVLIVLISQDEGQYDALPAVNGRNTMDIQNNYG